MNTKTVKFTKHILDVMFVSGIIVILTLPISLRYLAKFKIEVFMNQYIPMLIIFGISGILGVTIIYELRRMMKTVMEEECFVTDNVTNLRHMARLSFGITILWIIKLFFNPTPAALVIIIVFFIAALFSQVLACVFNQAIAYKEENDFTI